MSRCLGYFMKGKERPVTVLVATSGDTGGAVASGFLGCGRSKCRYSVPFRKSEPCAGTYN